MKQLYIIATLLIGCVVCQFSNTELDFSKLKAQLPNGIDFNENSIPQKEEVEKILREKCEKNGGASAYDDIANSRDKVQSCLEQYINSTEILDELDVAKNSGSMDEVFGKYCKKRPEIIGCVRGVIDKVELCLDSEEKENLKLLTNITDSLIDFMCFKDGDRLAMFVAEGGFECLRDQKDGIQDCVNKTLSEQMPKDISVTNLPMLKWNMEQCSSMHELQQCTVAELEKCKTNTPANIVEALFKFIKKVSPCKDYTPSLAMNQRNIDAAIRVLDKVKRSQPVGFSMVESFEGKCRKYAGPQAYRDLEKSVSNLKDCVQTQLRNPKACVRLPSEVRNCTNPVINKLRVCLPPQESYLTNFIHSSVDSFLKYVCDNNGKNYNRFIEPAGFHCLIASDPKMLNDCLEGTRTVRTKDDNIVTKVELCEKLSNIQNCLWSYITIHCSEMKDFRDVTTRMVEAIRAPCSGCNYHLNPLLFAGALILIISKFV